MFNNILMIMVNGYFFKGKKCRKKVNSVKNVHLFNEEININDSVFIIQAAN